MSCCGGEKKVCSADSTGSPPSKRPSKEPCSGTGSGERSSVQEFYAYKAETATPGRGNPCSASCPLDPGYPEPVVKALDLVHEDVKNTYFGCGLPYPFAVEGCRVLDLGSGTGRDCFLLAYLAGKNGHVTGVDMTPTMLEKSRGMIPYHAEKFGFENVEFVEGFLEKLDEVPALKPDTFDVIISNCVINLSPDKPTVFRHTFNLLKPGGELCFSDVYAEKEVPESLVKNELAWNECFSGALPWGEFLRVTGEIGFLGPYTVDDKPYVAFTDDLKEIIGDTKFRSKTCRLYKPPTAEKKGKEEGGGRLTYKGTIDGCAEEFTFSEDAVFKKGVEKDVSSDVLLAITGSRLATHFSY